MNSKQFERVTESQAWRADCSPSERLVLLALAKLQAKGEHPSGQDLADLTGFWLGTVQRLRRDLVNKGILKELPPPTKKTLRECLADLPTVVKSTR